jgi:hypothetical protein
MSLIPDGLRYTKEHEWVKESSPTVIRMGITDYAQGALGDIVYVQLPKVGDVVVADKVCGEVESTKSVSEILRPILKYSTLTRTGLVGWPISKSRQHLKVYYQLTVTVKLPRRSALSPTLFSA